MERKGQGALEYLLLIGGAVLVAVIVITLLLQITDSSSTGTVNTTIAAQCRQQGELQYRINDAINCSDITVDGQTCTGTAPNCTYNP